MKVNDDHDLVNDIGNLLVKEWIRHCTVLSVWLVHCLLQNQKFNNWISKWYIYVLMCVTFHEQHSFTYLAIIVNIWSYTHLYTYKVS